MRPFQAADRVVLSKVHIPHGQAAKSACLHFVSNKAVDPVDRGHDRRLPERHGAAVVRRVFDRGGDRYDRGDRGDRGDRRGGGGGYGGGKRKSF